MAGIIRAKATHRQMLNHKGYTGHIEVDLDTGILHGRVLGIRDVITFEGKTIEEAKQALQDSIDDYVEFCTELGDEPQISKC